MVRHMRQPRLHEDAHRGHQESRPQEDETSVPLEGRHLAQQPALMPEPRERSQTLGAIVDFSNETPCSKAHKNNNFSAPENLYKKQATHLHNRNETC
eukprot:4583890-Amphidinium_carterae.2